MKNIAVLGSTGSIGTQTLEVIRENKDLQVSALAANTNAARLYGQILEFAPKKAVLYDKAQAALLQKRLRLEAPAAAKRTEILAGMDGLLAAVEDTDVHIVLQAVSGMIGIRPTLAAIDQKKDIALANKETLVAAGHLIIPAAKANGVKLLPVDSEHSAIFQVLQAASPKEAETIYLTASGGPFRGKKRAALAKVRVEEALAHPTWSMGRKITVDSATMANKGLEVMEAFWLFGLPPKDITVLVHPQSVIHSMVAFRDGAVLAQLGTPDMRLPIQYALTYPERKPLSGKRLDFCRLKTLTFEAPDTDTFPALSLAYEALRAGGSMPTVYNAANEAAVALFLEGKLPFLSIAACIEACMKRHQTIASPDLAAILAVEAEVRAQVAAAV